MRSFALISVMILGILSSSFLGGAFASGPVEKKEAAASSLNGKVVETMDSGRYTYILLQTKERKVWVAVYKMKVSVGENISLKPGFEMVNFESKGLNRKFDKIIFSEGPVTNKKPSGDTKTR